MILIISPAKSLNFAANIPAKEYFPPQFLEDSQKLIDICKKLSAPQITALMKISPKLAELNYQRFANFHRPFTTQNAQPALYVFDGDVYKNIEVENYNPAQLTFAQNHLRILSGLYGLLKPLDLIQPYRLEMGTKLINSDGQNLYQFWQEKITIALNCELEQQNEKTMINLASEEYFLALNPKKISGRIINIVFKQKSGNQYKIIGFAAKKARGLMADFIIKNQLTQSSDIKSFNLLDYKFNLSASDESSWHFFK